MPSFKPELLLLILYFFSLLAFSFRAYRKNHTFDEYSTKYDHVTVPGLVCVVLASTVGYITASYLARQVYLYSEKWMYISIMVYFTGISTYIFYRTLPKDIRHCKSLPEIIRVRHGPMASLFVAFGSLILEAGSILGQYIALLQIFEYFFDFKPIYGLFATVIAVITAASFGGLRIIFGTSILQGFTFLVLIPLCITYTLAFQSGFSTIIQNLPELDTITSPELTKFSLFCLIIRGMFPLTNSPFVQRILIAKEPARIKKVLGIYVTITVIMGVSMVFIGFDVKSMGINVDPSTILLFYASNLPIALKSIMITGLISLATLHTLSLVNNTSVIIANDICGLFRKLSNRELMYCYRLSVVLMSLCPMLLLKKHIDFFTLIKAIYNFWEPVFLTQIIFIFFGIKQSKRGFFYSMLAGLIATFTSVLVGIEFNYQSEVIGSIANIITAVSISLAEGELKQFSLPKFSFNLKGFLSTVAPEARFKYDRYATFLLAFSTLLSVAVSELADPDLMMLSAGVSYLFAGVLFLRDVIIPRKYKSTAMPYVAYLGLILCTSYSAMTLIFASTDILTMLGGVFLLFSAFLFTDYRRAIFYLLVGSILFAATFPLIPHVSSTTQNEAIILGLVALILSIYMTYLQFQKSTYEEKFYRMLSGSIAHEIMTPVTAMNLNSDTISMLVENKEFDEIPEFTKQMSEAGYKAAAIVRSLLSAFKPEDSNKSEISALCVTMEAVNNFKKVDSRNQIEIEIDNDFLIKASFDKLYLVIFNLIKNAAKHGGKAKPIKVAILNKNITITDFGKGIHEDDIEKIFEPFYSSGGTGIGLALCDKIMSELGGNIVCRSKLGEFTTFQLRF